MISDEPRQPRRKLPDWLFAVLAVLAILAILAWLLLPHDSSAGKLRELIEKEVAKDFDHDRVEKWLDQYGFYVQYSTKPTETKINFRTPAQLAGLRDEDVKAFVWGRINGPKPEFGFNHSGQIDVYFFFDRNGNLVGRLVRPFVFSL